MPPIDYTWDSAFLAWDIYNLGFLIQSGVKTACQVVVIRRISLASSLDARLLRFVSFWCSNTKTENTTSKQSVTGWHPGYLASAPELLVMPIIKCFHAIQGSGDALNAETSSVAVISVVSTPWCQTTAATIVID